MTQKDINLLVATRLIKEMNDWGIDVLKEFLSSFTSKKELKDTHDFLQFITNNDEDDIADILDRCLDDLASQDAFGTEQQCDPRGDFRNGDFSMWNIENID